MSITSMINEIGKIVTSPKVTFDLMKVNAELAKDAYLKDRTATAIDEMVELLNSEELRKAVQRFEK